MELGTALAEHDLQVWRTYGPAAQAALVDGIFRLGDDERRGLAKLLTAMLKEILGSEVTGTTSTSGAVTFHRGAVVASDVLRDIRQKAIDLLKHQFELSADESERREVLFALHAATRPAIGAGYSNALARLVMDDTCSIIQFETDVAPTLSLGLRQSTESHVYRNYRRYEKLPDGMREDENLVAGQVNVRAAAFAFRDAVNADQDFVDFKTLVGFDCVYPPAWENDPFEYEEAETYRAQQVTALLASVTAENADEWFDKLSRYARIESDDAATFPVAADDSAGLSRQAPRSTYQLHACHPDRSVCQHRAGESSFQGRWLGCAKAAISTTSRGTYGRQIPSMNDYCIARRKARSSTATLELYATHF